MGVQHTAFRAHITVDCIGSNINLLCFNSAINIDCGISSNDLPIKMGIGSSGGSIIFFILVGFFNYNIIQCLRAQLGIACSLHLSAICNAKLCFNLSAGNFAEVIQNAVVIIIIIISCENDIAAASLFCSKCNTRQTGFNFISINNILKIKNSSTNRRTRCRCACSYITYSIFTYIFAYANLGSAHVNSIYCINLA